MSGITLGQYVIALIGKRKDHQSITEEIKEELLGKLRAQRADGISTTEIKRNAGDLLEQIIAEKTQPKKEIPEKTKEGIPEDPKKEIPEKTKEGIPEDPKKEIPEQLKEEILDSEEDNSELEEMTTDWGLAMKFVPYFTGAEKGSDATKYVSFDTFKKGCETADEFIVAADKKKGARILWATKISSEVTNRIPTTKEFATIKEMLEVLAEVFDQHRKPDEIREDLYEAKQRRGEKVSEFIDRVDKIGTELLNAIAATVPEEEKLGQISSAKSDLKTAVKKGVYAPGQKIYFDLKEYKTFEDAKADILRKVKDPEEKKDNSKKDGKCYKCGKFGHFAKECRGGDKEKNQNRPHSSGKTFVARKDEGADPLKCYNCGGIGHRQFECPSKRQVRRGNTENNREERPRERQGNESRPGTARQETPADQI
jgi:hypothetical protein